MRFSRWLFGGAGLVVLLVVLRELAPHEGSGKAGHGPGHSGRAAKAARATLHPPFDSDPPDVQSLPPMSGAIGDPTNPEILIPLPPWAARIDPHSVQAESSNPAVVAPSHVSATVRSDGQLAVAVDPIGVGYAHVRVTLEDAAHRARYSFDYAANAMEPLGGRWHLGASDGSTAVAISPELMFIGDDEDQTLRLYRRDRSGFPVAEFDQNPYLGLTEYHHNGRPKEIDIEASVRVGQRIFWLGSQSHDRAGLVALNRSRIFATDLSGDGAETELRFVGRYDHLLVDLVEWDEANLHGRGSNFLGLAASVAPGVSAKAEGGEGFAVEGLCLAVDEPGTALLGFRAPVVPPGDRRFALLVPLRQFASLAISGAAAGAARFGEPIELDLGGRGIRAIQSGGDHILIVAGPARHDSPKREHEFRLFTWTGRRTDRPEERDTDLTGLHPEAIVELPPWPWTPESTVQLVSDNGTTELYGDDVPAKSLRVPAFKKCRSDWVKLGNAIVR